MEITPSSTDIHIYTYTQGMLMHMLLLLTSPLIHEPKWEKISKDIYMLIFLDNFEIWAYMYNLRLLKI